MTTSVIRDDRPTRVVAPVPDADPEWLRAAVEAAEPGPLLMALVHMTGDRRLLAEFRERLATARAAQPTPLPPGQYPQEVAAEVRDRAHNLLGPVLDPALDAPDDELFLEMIRVATDDAVGPEYVPYLRDQAGFAPLPGTEPRHRSVPPEFRVAVVGGGMVGINAAVKLAEAGFTYRVFEAGDDIGGTWARNTYPGAAVDTPSHFYSYSFELNPEWSKFYPAGPEYLRYLHHVADKYGIRPHIALRTRVLGCEWLDERQLWRVTTAGPDGQEQVYEANAVITATGILNSPSVPDIPGAESFAGTSMHTAEWDESADLTGKRVVVLGTGCTSVQVVASLAGRAGHLDVVFRQPHWIAPERNVVSRVDEATRWAMRHIPYYQQWYRLVTHWFTADKSYDIPRIDPEWYAEHVSASPANDRLMQICLRHLQEELGDRPDLMRMLTPDFPPFAKRIVKDPGFLAAVRRDDVDLHRAGFERIEPTGVRLTNGTFLEADVIIWATGFRLEYLSFLNVVGRGGTTLAQSWDGGDDPRAHLGIGVPGFPNFFVTAGPNSAPNHGGGHNVTSEEHVHYAIACLRHLVDHGYTAMEPTPEATEAYNARVDEELEHTVWKHGGSANGYYRNAAGRAWVTCPWRLVDYWSMLRAPDPKHLLLQRGQGVAAGG
ncbi:flavin-containing monooxygenase [Streptomyces albidoflavus]